MFQCTLTYDGTRYFGWQKTIEGPSIQEEIEKAILKITGETVVVEAASRTDRGVHATGQVIQFTLKKPSPLYKLQRGLNAALPCDIRILTMTPKQFHPTLDAINKEYHYSISLGAAQSPIDRLYSWHFYYPIESEKIEIAANAFIGTHDFSALANEEEKNPICTIESIVFENYRSNLNKFKIKGDRFLYKMVRNIVGTLIYIGSGKLPSNAISDILNSRDRKKAGITAPAHGLYLHQVFYPLK